MSKQQRLWHSLSIGGAHAATPMSTMAIGAAFLWVWDPTIVTGYDEGFVRFLGFGFLGMFSLFTLVGAIGHWSGCRCDA